MRVLVTRATFLLALVALAAAMPAIPTTEEELREQEFESRQTLRGFSDAVIDLTRYLREDVTFTHGPFDDESVALRASHMGAQSSSDMEMFACVNTTTVLTACNAPNNLTKAMEGLNKYFQDSTDMWSSMAQGCADTCFMAVTNSLATCAGIPETDQTRMTFAFVKNQLCSTECGAPTRNFFGSMMRECKDDDDFCSHKDCCNFDRILSVYALPRTCWAPIVSLVAHDPRKSATENQREEKEWACQVSAMLLSLPLICSPDVMACDKPWESKLMTATSSISASCLAASGAMGQKTGTCDSACGTEISNHFNTYNVSTDSCCSKTIETRFMELAKLKPEWDKECLSVMEVNYPPGCGPTPAPTSSPTTAAPTTKAPTSSPTTAAPTTSPAPTMAPTTGAPTTAAPTNAPTTAAPTTTSSPTAAPTTAAPTTAAPTNAPTTAATASPTTASPTNAPTTASPTNAPTTAAPTNAAPTATPTTAAPTFPPTTGAPTTAAPTHSPTTAAPTSPPTCGSGRTESMLDSMLEMHRVFENIKSNCTSFSFTGSACPKKNIFTEHKCVPKAVAKVTVKFNVDFPSSNSARQALQTKICNASATIAGKNLTDIKCSIRKGSVIADIEIVQKQGDTSTKTAAQIAADIKTDASSTSGTLAAVAVAEGGTLDTTTNAAATVVEAAPPAPSSTPPIPPGATDSVLSNLAQGKAPDAPISAADSLVPRLATLALAAALTLLAL